MSEFNAETGNSGLSLGTVFDGVVTGARKGVTATKQAATDNGFGRAWTAFRSDPEAKLPADYEDNVSESLDSETESVKHKLDGGLTTTKQFANNSKRRFGAAWEELTSKGKMSLVGMAAVLLVFVGIVPSHANNNPAKAGEQYWSAFYQRDAKKVCSIGYRSLNFTSYDRCINAVPARLAGLTEEQRSYLKDQRCETVFKEAKSAEVECHGNYDWDVAYLGLERQGRKWFVIAN